MKAMQRMLTVLLTALTILTACPALAAKESLPLTGLKVAIDPGHQRTRDYRQEPIGPGMRGTKPRNKDGAGGISTKRRESVVNLEIGLKLRDELESMGADVFMTRTVEDVKLSNRQRAALANAYQPDVYLRLHCNGSSNHSRQGIKIYYPKKSPYQVKVASQKEYTRYAKLLFKSMTKSTGRKKGGIKSNDDYPGTNWSKSLTFLVEMGYMSNREEDRLLSTPSYQNKLIKGMVNFCKIILAEKKGELIKSISLTPKTKATLKKGERLKLAFKVTPSTAKNQTLSWISGNPKVAKVSKDGVVTAVKAGKAKISAKSNDSFAVTTSIQITVK